MVVLSDSALELQYGLFDYQDLANFLPESFQLDDLSDRSLKARRVRDIHCLKVWLEAWQNYKTGILMRAPHLAGELEAYVTVIRTASAQYSWKSVYAYDVAFRTKLAEHPESTRWTERDPDLGERFFIIPHKRVQTTLASYQERLVLPLVFGLGGRGLLWRLLVRLNLSFNGALWRQAVRSLPPLRALTASSQAIAPFGTLS